MIAENKLPPQNTELERAVLGTLLMHEDSLLEVGEILTENCFYLPRHQVVFRAIETLYAEGKNHGMIEVFEYLKKQNTIDIAEGLAGLQELNSAAAMVSTLGENAISLKEKEIKRAQINLGQQLVKKAYDYGGDPIELNEWAGDEIYRLANNMNTQDEPTLSDMADQTIEDIHTAFKKKGVTGVRSGFVKHDKVTGGYQPGNFILKAARPGMGKTAMMLCEVYDIGFKQGLPVVVFSLEMTALELYKRLVLLHTQEDAKIFKPKTVDVHKMVDFRHKLDELSKSNIIILDKYTTQPKMRNRLKREKIKHPNLAAAYVDYIQLMSGRGQNREAEISGISRSLKETAKELAIPIIALSQLSREVEKRTPPKPRLSDLRESGSLEQDADIVQFLFRPSYYDKEAEDKGLAWLDIAKHRNGELANIKLKFIHAKTQFIDYDKPEDQNDDDLPF